MNIGRINVMQICTRSNWYRRGNTKPTLRKRMFTIIPASTLNTITGALVVTQLIVSNVGISIANSYTIIEHVSGGKCSPNTIECPRPIFNLLELYSLIFSIDNLEECRLQSFATLAIGSLIIGAGVVWSLCPSSAEG